MASKLGAVAIVLAVMAVVLALNPPTHLLRPPPVPGAHDCLHASKVVPVGGAHGPESLTFDPSGGGPYAGVADGQILKWEGDERGWVNFAFTSSQRKECTRPFAPELEHVCGRPLGLRFDKKTGDLYIADAYFGLMVVGPDGGLATLVANQAEGEPFRFTNDLDIDESEDVIYFTDSSTTYHRRQFLNAFLSGNRTGRLMKYDKSSKGLKVLLRGLAFPNGVALSKDGLFLLVAESATGRILRLWLKGPNAGKFDIFADLPGYPDNIKRNSRGEFWVALHAKKGPVLRFLLSNSLIGNFALRLPISLQKLHLLLVGGKAEATAVKLGKEGEILEVVEDKEGKTVQFISEVEERDNKLWIGSVMRPFIGIYDLN
ncbi:protein STRICTOSIDINE SYNTHASE-LIKE 10-like [Syzygium oleosum]|uniref:protein STRICTOSIDINE SYNTHASE-LIKE 10-like n=1 Tax=Syzygium oleosum TaxID=219896 RepID=UPI0024BA51B5|nr:protein STRICTOSIDINE SYNTHASE-LIKE 10-like [Syzygium oleosum]